MKRALGSHTKNKADYIPFAEIGSGAQFHAYDMHDGRILKIPLTEAETYRVAKQRRNTTADLVASSLNARVQTFINGKARIPAVIQHDFADNDEWLALLGNPSLIPVEHILPEDTLERRWGSGRIVYTQDKANMTHEILHNIGRQPRVLSGDIKRLEQLIDTYVEHIYKLWSYGFTDYTFKIGDTGFTANGSLISVDLGEFSSDTTFLKRVVAQQRWRNSIDSSKKDFPQIPRAVQDYYQRTLENAFTVKEFEKRWRTKHNCSSCLVNNDIITAFIAAKVAEIDYVDRW